MGSGAMAVAALQANRRFVRYEINVEHVNIAEQRVAPIRTRRAHHSKEETNQT